MKSSLFSFLVFFPMIFLCSCADHPTATIIPTAPPAAVAVSPAVASVRNASNLVASTSSKLENQVDSLHRSASDLRADLAKSVIEADRLQKQKSATEAELQGLWQMLTSTQSQVASLYSVAEAALATAEDQKTLRARLERDLDDLAMRAAARDTEAEILRMQREDLVAAVNASSQETAVLRKKLSKSESKAAVGNYLRNWITTAVILVFVLVGGLFLFRFVRP